MQIDQTNLGLFFMQFYSIIMFFAFTYEYCKVVTTPNPRGFKNNNFQTWKDSVALRPARSEPHFEQK